MASLGDTFKPGHKVPHSGVYEVTHNGHHPTHEVTCIAYKQFPPCKHCGQHSRFKLVYKAVHIAADDNFK